MFSGLWAMVIEECGDGVDSRGITDVTMLTKLAGWYKVLSRGWLMMEGEVTMTGATEIGEDVG